MRQLHGIIIHCTATRPDWWASKTTSQKVKEVRRWHVEGNKWSDIGYHFLIDRNGKVADGRPIDRNGAHVRGHNKGTIGVSLFGGHGAASTDQFEDHFTPEQEASLRALIADLHTKYGYLELSGHNEYANKGCPGFNVRDWANKTQPEPLAPPERKSGGLLAFILSLFRRSS